MGFRNRLKGSGVGVRGRRNKEVPTHVERNRRATGRRLRKILLGYVDDYGREVQVLKRWAWFVGHWCGRGFFTYRELLDLCEEWKGILGDPEPLVEVPQEEHPKGWGWYGQYARWDQDALMIPFSRYVQRVADARSSEEVERRRVEFMEQLSLGRAKEAMRELVFNECCPVCGEDLRERDLCGHGYFGARLGPGNNPVL